MGGVDRVSVLTVWDTLVLDLQVLVGPWTGVWEHVRPSYHNTLCAVITPAREDRQGKEGRKEREERK